MKTPNYIPRLKGFRYRPEIIAYAVWVYYSFALSTADVEDPLAAWDVIVSREAIWRWINRFGRNLANCILKDRSRLHDKWRLDKFLITIRGKTH